jgi:hypothetical protein
MELDTQGCECTQKLKVDDIDDAHSNPSSAPSHEKEKTYTTSHQHQIRSLSTVVSRHPLSALQDLVGQTALV